MSQVRRIADWIVAVTGGDPYEIRSGYHLAGRPILGSDYFTTCFVAPFGVALITKPRGEAYPRIIGLHFLSERTTMRC